MRVVVIVVGIVLVTTPSHASRECMTRAEARQHFGSAHLYWHGSNHCWDANSGQQVLVHRIRVRPHRPPPREIQEAKPEEPGDQQPKWREAMSEMLPNEASAAPSLLRMPPSGEESEAPSPPNWGDRWVDVAQVTPAADGGAAPAEADPSPAAAQKIDPRFTPTRVILAFLALVLTLAVIEILFRTTIYDPRR
jgi:hypothetical protein